MARDPSWDFVNPSSRPRIVAAIRREAASLSALASSPARWHDPTACAGWELRDLVAHLVDSTEVLLEAFSAARMGAAPPPPVDPGGRAEAYDAAAKALRSLPRDDVLARYDRSAEGLVAELEALTEEEWTSLVVPDPYAGPLPAMAFAAAWLAGYTVHAWDGRQGQGARHAVDAVSADLLVPFVSALWQATADTSGVDEPFAIGVRTTGRNGGDRRIEVSREGVRVGHRSLDGCAAVIDVDAGTLLLLAYNRVDAGTVHGDPERAAQFLSLFRPV